MNTVGVGEQELAIVPISILTAEQKEHVRFLDSHQSSYEENTARASLEGQIDEAADDLDYMRNVARRLDDALAEVDTAQIRLNTLAEAFLRDHGNLGISLRIKDFFQSRAWEKSMEIHVKNKCSVPGSFSIAATIPGITETLVGDVERSE